MNRRASHMYMTAAQAAEKAASFRMEENSMNQSDMTLGLGSVYALSFFVLKGIIIRFVSLVIIRAGLAAGEYRMQTAA